MPRRDTDRGNAWAGAAQGAAWDGGIRGTVPPSHARVGIGRERDHAAAHLWRQPPSRGDARRPTETDRHAQAIGLGGEIRDPGRAQPASRACPAGRSTDRSAHHSDAAGLGPDAVHRALRDRLRRHGPLGAPPTLPSRGLHPRHWLHPLVASLFPTVWAVGDPPHPVARTLPLVALSRRSASSGKHGSVPGAAAARGGTGQGPPTAPPAATATAIIFLSLPALRSTLPLCRARALRLRPVLPRLSRRPLPCGLYPCLAASAGCRGMWGSGR